MAIFALRPGVGLKLGSLALLTASLTVAAAAEDCDCSRRVGLCQAEASYDGERISFTTFTQLCSRVSFSIAGHAAAFTVRRGFGSVRFAAPGATGATPVDVEACFVCDVEATR